MNDMNDTTCLEHGLTTYVFPSDTALELATARKAALEAAPNVVSILTADPHTFLLAVQHRIKQGYFVADESVIAIDADYQSVILFKHLNNTTIQGA